MGNPLRFFGAGDPFEADGEVIPTACSVEVTFRAHQARFLLRPDKQTNAIVLACLGRAYHRYPGVRIHALSVLSNHGCLLCTPESPAVLSSFMRDFLSTLATQLNDLRKRTGTFFERRYRAIPTVDEARVEERFAYVLCQGTKENLVSSAKLWPGVSSVRTQLGGPPLVGHWRDRTREHELRTQRDRRRCRARTAGRTAEPGKVPHVYLDYPIELVALPHWRDAKPGQLRDRVARILHADDEATRARHQRDGTRPLGVRAILAQQPTGAPAEPARSPAPLCHASRRSQRKAFHKAYAAHVASFHAAAAALATHVPSVGFRPGYPASPLWHPGPVTPPSPEPAPRVVWT